METNTNEKVNEILVANGLDFSIEKLPMFAKQGDDLIPSEYFGLLNGKTNEIINTVKGGYTISQNKEVVEAVLMGMEPFGDKLNVTKAGSLNGGRKTFLQLGIEGLSKVGDDTLKKYVTIIDSNDGSTGLSVGIGNLTMSCSNQFFRFYKAGQMKAKHTYTIEAKIKGLPELISLSLEESLKIIEVFNKFKSTEVSRELADKLVKEIMGFDKFTPEEVSTRSKNSMESLYSHITKETNDKGFNLWGLHSGVTSWTTHEKSAPKRENGRLESIMVGTNYETNQKSMEFCLTESGIDRVLLS